MKLGTMVTLNMERLENELVALREMGFETCQLCCWQEELLTTQNARLAQRLLGKHGVQASAFWCGWPGPCEWNFTYGPVTIGLVPAAYRAKRLETLQKGSDFTAELGVEDLVTHMGFIPVNPQDADYAGFLGAVRTLARHCERHGQHLLFETGQEPPVALAVTTHQPKVTQAALEQAIKEIGIPAMSGKITVVAGTKSGPFSPQRSLSKILTLVSDGQGNLVGWEQHLVGQSFIVGTPFEKVMVKDGIDQVAVEGAADLPYAVPNLRVEQTLVPEVKVPTQWWRSVGHTHTAYSTETLIDEAAVAAGKDPYEFRRALLEKHPRHLGVLDLVADKAGWKQPLKAGGEGEKRGRGIAVHESFGSFVAQVVEVTVKADKSFRIDRVVCAVDCGLAINPDVIRAQMEGGIGYGLAMALHSAITLKEGVVEQSNFHDFQVLRINEMPMVEVHIVPSSEAPTGVGEPGVPPAAPALANALAAATGKRIRNLPIGNQLQA